VDAFAGEVSELGQFLLTGQAKLEAWRDDREAELGPEVREHGHDSDDQARPALLVIEGLARSRVDTALVGPAGGAAARF
jgi:hypothetical protein